jgi:hypothetical protein
MYIGLLSVPQHPHLKRRGRRPVPLNRCNIIFMIPARIVPIGWV